MPDQPQDPTSDDGSPAEGESSDQRRRDGLSDSAVMDAMSEGGTPDPDAEVEGEFVMDVEVEDESGEALGEVQEALSGARGDDQDGSAGFEEAMTQTAAAASTTRRPPAPKKKSANLKATAIPMLATVGFLLLVLPVRWSFFHLTGISVSKEAGANTMAWVMFLLATPVSGILIAAAVWMYLQLQREKEEAAAKKAAVLQTDKRR